MSSSIEALLTKAKESLAAAHVLIKDGYYDIDYLNSQPEEMETNHVRVVSFTKAVKVMINGKLNKGVILKAE